MTEDTKSDLPILELASQTAWEQWLDAHHAESRGVWLKFAKKGAKRLTVSYAEAVEGALCYGWIDGQAAPLDEQFWLQRFTPRRRRSKCSQINRDKATALADQGRLRTAGALQVEEAQRDGRWDAAYASPARSVVPDDLQRALDENPAAQAFFDTLNSTNRYAILFRLHDARKPETRARRLDQFITMLKEKRKLYP